MPIYNSFGEVISSTDNITTNHPPGYSVDDLYLPVYYDEETSTAKFNGTPLFTNMNYVTESAQHFEKYGRYTNLDPIKDRYEYQLFWDREERRRRYGLVLPGGVLLKENNKWVTKKIWITGEHYGYLNYARIQATEKESRTKNLNRTRQKETSFPDFWDWDFVYFHVRALARRVAKHLAIAKARRKGYSYKNGWCAANRFDLVPGRSTIIGAHLLKYITKGTGMMTMARTDLDFLNAHTDWYKGRLNNSIDFLRSGYTLKGEAEERGFKSQIFALSFEQSADSAIGKDADEVYLDEAGAFPNLDPVLSVTIPTMEDGSYVTGMCTVFGTGGTKGANWEPFENCYYNPDMWNMMAFENIFEPEDTNATRVSFWHGYLKNLIPFIDKDGNSIESAAKIFSDDEFKKKKDVERDIEKLNLYRGQRAEKPSQAFIRNSNGYLSSPELLAYLSELSHSKHLATARRSGIFEQNKFVETNEVIPLDKFPLKGISNYNGCYVEFSPLYIDKRTGKIPDNLYRVWHDPYDVDKDVDKINLRNSFGAAYLYERINNFTPSRGDILKGIYYGRPGRTDDYNSQLFQLIEWANAKMLFENDRGQVIPYAKRIRATHRLVEEPSIEWAKELKGGGSRGYGISIGDTNRKLKGAQLLRDWLYTPRGRRDDGSVIYNFHYITDVATLSEIAAWNLAGNFDRVSALIVGMYDLQESLYIPQEESETTNVQDEDFFGRNWYQ